MTSITTAIEQELDPRVVTNALYETMLDWRGAHATYLARKSKNSMRSVRANRRACERMLGRFLNMTPDDVRRMLCDHYGLEYEE